MSTIVVVDDEADVSGGGVVRSAIKKILPLGESLLGLNGRDIMIRTRWNRLAPEGVNGPSRYPDPTPR